MSYSGSNGEPVAEIERETANPGKVELHEKYELKAICDHEHQERSGLVTSSTEYLELITDKGVHAGRSDCKISILRLCGYIAVLSASPPPVIYFEPIRHYVFIFSICVRACNWIMAGERRWQNGEEN